MSGVLERPISETKQDNTWIPPLENGDFLTRAEFERRYSAMPHLEKAELIEGVVYMPSPLSVDHGAHGSDDYANSLSGALRLAGGKRPSVASLITPQVLAWTSRPRLRARGPDWSMRGWGPH